MFQTDEESKQHLCSGVYGKGEWGGSTDPFIEVDFDAGPSGDSLNAIVSFVVFEWRDEAFLGAEDRKSRDGMVPWP